MNKQEFITKLKAMLTDLPEKEINDRIDFYSEMIDDRIEDGLTEEEAVKDIGTVEEVAKQIINEIPLFKIIKHKLKKSKNEIKSEIHIGEPTAIKVISHHERFLFVVGV